MKMNPDWEYLIPSVVGTLIGVAIYMLGKGIVVAFGRYLRGRKKK